MEGGRWRGSFGGVMVEDTEYEVLRIFEWQDKGMVAFAKARTLEEDRVEYGICSFEMLTHSTAYCIVFAITSSKFL